MEKEKGGRGGGMPSIKLACAIALSVLYIAYEELARDGSQSPSIELDGHIILVFTVMILLSVCTCLIALNLRQHTWKTNALMVTAVLFSSLQAALFFSIEPLIGASILKASFAIGPFKHVATCHAKFRRCELENVIIDTILDGLEALHDTHDCATLYDCSLRTLVSTHTMTISIAYGIKMRDAMAARHGVAIGSRGNFYWGFSLTSIGSWLLTVVYPG